MHKIGMCYNIVYLCSGDLTAEIKLERQLLRRTTRLEHDPQKMKRVTR